ncbi:hypothetical protein K435DRAFT_493379 [Dendrothele bispora CBS 962.96]|uniref:Uncharacterized protein n=1 Tax=Dendrothele bispora (strain CBS 962.96) TaxID=1314807 RepID=A0A4S8KXQ6_DENBC|nr:hypothetical protein K435DRAFT_493379 [Dendrothele bispora CBS 962.96]
MLLMLKKRGRKIRRRRKRGELLVLVDSFHPSYRISPSDYSFTFSSKPAPNPTNSTPPFAPPPPLLPMPAIFHRAMEPPNIKHRLVCLFSYSLSN